MMLFAKAAISHFMRSPSTLQLENGITQNIKFMREEDNEPPIRGGNSEYFDSVVSNGVFVGFVTVVCSPHF
jgi:hypothetical protein